MARHVFRNYELADVWTKQEQEHGRAPSMFFDGDKIFSYGRHYCIARIVATRKGTCALFNSIPYSSSTARHRSYTYRALRGLSVPIFSAIDPATNDKMAIFEEYLERLTAMAFKIPRARSRRASYIREAASLQNEIFQYLHYFPITNKEQRKADFYELLHFDFVNFDIEQYRAIRYKAARRKAVRMIREEKRHARELRTKNALRHRETHRLMWAFTRYETSRYYSNDHIKLRESLDGNTIECSNGHSMPIDKARELYTSVFVENKSGILPGIVHTVTMPPNGNYLQVGCTKIPISEINRIAKRCNFLNIQYA